jgi:hypothetical protein
MARIHGRNGALYADQSAGANSTATIVAFMSDYTVDQKRDRAEVTAFGDASKVYLAGLPDASGSVNGFYDDGGSSAFAIADGVERKFYKYVSTTSTANMAPISGSGKGYWYGTATFDVSTTVGVGDAVKVSLNWSAASSVYKV